MTVILSLLSSIGGGEVGKGGGVGDGGGDDAGRGGESGIFDGKEGGEGNGRCLGDDKLEPDVLFNNGLVLELGGGGGGTFGRGGLIVRLLGGGGACLAGTLVGGEEVPKVERGDFKFKAGCIYLMSWKSEVLAFGV